MWNRVEYRPLEGFVFAVTPFNFTSIAATCPRRRLWSATSCSGNRHRARSIRRITYELLHEAGVPDGVINFVPGSGGRSAIPRWPARIWPVFTSPARRRLPGHVEDRRRHHSEKKYYPRIVGETGGKDFIFAHASCDVEAFVTALIRGRLSIRVRSVRPPRSTRPFDLA